MDFTEKTVSKEYIYKGKILNLRKDTAILPNGKECQREVVEHSGGSCILCEKDGKILLVKQFRYPYKKEILELPAGKLNPNETPEQTAIRELKEEGGLEASKVEKMFDIYPSPAYTEEIIRIYRATEFTECEQKLDEDEFLSAIWVDKDEIRKMIDSGEIVDAKTLVALLRVL